MKKRYTIILILLVSFTTIFAQNTNVHLVPILERSVPKDVLTSFREMYPNVPQKTWYTTQLSYWYNDYRTDWYGNWYVNRTIVYYDFKQSNYFEVNFIKGPGENSRAIFNRYGYWYETRTQLKLLPQDILDHLAKTQYADWKRAPHKERIEAPGWPLSVYRFRVTKGLKSKIIRMDEKGNIIQEREIYV